MNRTIQTRYLAGGQRAQKGVVLFFALIALVIMALAAVGLIRSIDTNTLIAGNLAFKQSATSSADGGVESAITWLTANSGAVNSSNAAVGYFNSMNKAINLTTLNWTAANTSKLVGTDPAGNTVRYIIQRMCTHPAAAAGALSSGTTIVPDDTNCLFSDVDSDTNSKQVLDATQAGAGLSGGGSPIYRVTAQVTGAKNTISYVQAFVY